MEVGRGISVTRVTGDEARGDVQSPAKADGKVGKVPAHPGPRRQRVACCRVRWRGADQIVDIVPYPLADALHALAARSERSELAQRQRKKQIRFAISSRQEIRKNVTRQLGNR